MKNLTNGQEVKVISGTHAGKIGWFNKLNAHREGKCFIWLNGTNVIGAQVSLSCIEVAR